MRKHEMLDLIEAVYDWTPPKGVLLSDLNVEKPQSVLKVRLQGTVATVTVRFDSPLHPLEVHKLLSDRAAEVCRVAAGVGA